MLLAWSLLLLALPAGAQEEGIDDVFGGFGSAEAIENGEATERRPGEGSIFGRLIDGETGAAIPQANVILIWPEPPDGSQARQEIRSTDSDGGFEFASVPPGSYTLTFVKAGYRTSTMTNVEVLPDQANEASFPMPPVAVSGTGDVLELDPFSVEQSAVGSMMTDIEIRMDADQLLNVMSAEDLSKFAASDVAEALTRVAGINIQEGQFAIIRGLEDRYSSTVFNGAPVPSPDPNRQSVQLDLFPSEVVDNLVVAKSFSPNLPSNSSGGSIDIVTQQYPDEWELEFKAKGGVNDNAWDRFLKLRNNRNPIGDEIDGFKTLEHELGVSFGGRDEIWSREIRARAVVNWGTDYRTSKGWRESRQPRDLFANGDGAGDLAFGGHTLTEGRFDRTLSVYEEQLTYYAGLGIDLDEEGLHKVDFAFFRTEKDTELVQRDKNGYLPRFAYNGPGGPVEQARDEGIFAEPGEFQGGNLPGRFSPNFKAENPLNQNANDAWFTNSLRNETERVVRGPLWFSSFGEESSLDRERKLTLYQLNGDHEFDFLDDLHFSWATNYASTRQDERSRSLRYWYEACGYQNQGLFRCSDGGRIPIPEKFPVTRSDLGEGFHFAQNSGLLESGNWVDEDQWFARFDFDYEREFLPWLQIKANFGFWYEDVERDVDADFIQRNIAVGSADCNPPDPQTVDDLNCIGERADPTLLSRSRTRLGKNAFNVAFQREEDGRLANATKSKNEYDREIKAAALASKTTLWEDFDLLLGLRIERIEIESKNDPFTGDFFFDKSPNIFPRKYLFFDRFDNEVREFQTREPPFNDELINFGVPLGVCRGENPAAGEAPPDEPAPGLEDQECVDLATASEIQSVLNTEIKKTKYLPSVGFAWRAAPGLTLRGAYSKTVARPSARELGYYVSFDPSENEFVVGNPGLGLSDVESWDLRAEYVFGDSADLVAISGFYKDIDEPIESIILRDAAVVTNNTGEVSDFRTFFNNPATADLYGVEMEARKALDFIPNAEWLSYVSLGGNFTYIDAKIKRTAGEISRSETFYSDFRRTNNKRRLFGQPEWIANADITFDQPDWGTKATLAFFAISDVLDSIGTGVPSADGQINSFTADRYVDEFHTLDLVVSQQLPWGFSIKGTAKNLTDSQRRLIYDRKQSEGRVTERKLKRGRDYTVELKFTYLFGAD